MRRTPTEDKAIKAAERIPFKLGSETIAQLREMPRTSAEYRVALAQYELKVAATNYLEREDRLFSWSIMKTSKDRTRAQELRITWPAEPTRKIRERLQYAYQSLLRIEASPLFYTETPSSQASARIFRQARKMHDLHQAMDAIRAAGGNPYPKDKPPPKNPFASKRFHTNGTPAQLGLPFKPTL